MRSTSASSATPSATASSSSDSCLSSDSERSSMAHVRFEETCVLIPELQAPSRGPRIVTKSYSLPLWKRGAFGIGASSSGSHDAEDLRDACPAPGAQAEPEHLTVKVALPSFGRKTSHSKSPTRHTHPPLSPCLVHRHSTTPLNSSVLLTPARPPRARRPSLPSARPASDVSLETIPLRPCCTDCLGNAEVALPPLTEDAPCEWDWDAGVHFSKGAMRRRRSASVDKGKGLRGEYGGLLTAVPIKVDEVDKRLSLEKAREEARGGALCEDRNAQDGSFLSGLGEYPGTRGDKCKKLQMDDEDQLFPLPSPRRSPNASPVPSPCSSSSNVLLPAMASDLENVQRKKQMNIAQKPSPSPPPAPSPENSASHTQHEYFPTHTPPPTQPIPISTPSPRRESPNVVERERSASDHSQSVSLNSSPSSPPLSTSPLASPSSSPGKRRRPSFPSPASFMKVGAGVLKGMNLNLGATAGPGASGGTMGLSV